MKDNRTEKLQVTANAAEAEQVDEVVAGPKKFKDVQALIDAYTALEAEFTRRSQRLKELEANKEQGSSVCAENAQATSEAAPSQEVATGSGDMVKTLSPQDMEGDRGVRPLTLQEKNAVIEEYLSGVYSNRSVPFITAGGAVKAARTTPKSLSEAGSLARKYFDKQED